MKDAQIESLQAQINPHFLYNTLDCINSLADMGKTTEVKKTVTSLGSIMRMSIKGTQFLKIEEELKNEEGKDYLKYIWLDLDNINEQPILPQVVKEILKEGKYPEHKINIDSKK